MIDKKEKEREMRAHDRKPRAKRERSWGNDYWAAANRKKNIAALDELDANEGRRHHGTSKQIVDDILGKK